MKLSVIIVNYNVKYFLEQCLLSVIRACQGINSEIIVVDNASSDGSTDLIRSRFPTVKLTANTENVGFAKANNQGIREAQGEFVLLLNPDTLVAEDTFTKCLAFMDAHPDAGALGVRMIDGTGRFLPESKRGLPTPAVSFFKVFGLSKLFPRSRVFNRYHLGYLSENETQPVDVLAGAFMMIRSKVLEEIGPLDERFFMYGEDIDLSYRITQAGYKNYYFPETTIIHYKGESTKKGSLNYVRMFYQAMILFAEKHFSKGRARAYRWAIRCGVYLKALSAGISTIMRSLWLPTLEAASIYGGIWLVKGLYARNVKDAAEYYPEEFMYYIVPIYVTLWIVAAFFSGGYDRPLRIGKAVRGVFVGTILIAAVYGFLPEHLRYSRAIIILGAAWAGFVAIALRALALMVSSKSLRISPHRAKRVAIVGEQAEGQRVLHILNQTGTGHNFIGFVAPAVGSAPAAGSGNRQAQTNGFIGTFSDLEHLTRMYELDEVVFCTKDMPVRSVILRMMQSRNLLSYRIAPEESAGILGSDSKKTAGDLYAADVNLAIAHPGNRRSKRLFDLFVCLILLVVFPISLLVISNPAGLVRNWFQVLIGKKSWVGYSIVQPTPSLRETERSEAISPEPVRSLPPTDSSAIVLPPLRPGVLNPATAWKAQTPDVATLHRLNLLYAREYAVSEDWKIVRRNLRHLGTL